MRNREKDKAHNSKRGDNMLIRLNVKNFLSFSERENKLSHEFCMISGKTRLHNEHLLEINNIKALKFAAIFGANASGKTNLLKVLSFIKQTVTSGMPESFTKMFCRTQLANESHPSYFEVQFSIGNACYSYGFEIILSKGEFISEWLVEVIGQSEHELFSRDIKSGKTKLSKKIFSSKLKMYADDILDDSSSLLITVMNKNKNHFFDDHPEALPLFYVFNWLNSKLKILPLNKENLDLSYMFDSQKYDKICNLLRLFDTGITGYIINADNIMFKHGDITLPLSHESSGTIQLLGLLEILLLDEADDITYIIDNLDSGRSLHPLLTYYFVNKFLKLANKRNLQMIVTTHETILLNFDLLRRDEIWFVDKDIERESRIYSLDEFNVRFDKVIDKAYLEGRYGGIPIFKKEM